MFKYIFLLVLVSMPVYAQDIGDTSLKLKDIEKSLSAEQLEQTALKEKQDLLEKQLKTVNAQTSKTVKIIKATERDAAKIRDSVNALKVTQATYKREQARTEKMIVPLLSNAMDIKSIPADLNLFLNTEADIKSQLTTHVALQSAATSIKNMLENYQEATQKLMDTEKELEKKQAKLDQSLEGLSKERDTLSKQVEQQTMLKNETDKDLKDKSETVSDLQLKRESLSTLLDQLKREEIERKEARARERERNKQKERDVAKSDKKEVLRDVKASSKRKLASGLPASGYVISDFGDIDPDSGLEAKGITIEGEPSGLVTAPKSGEVRYTGAFRSMGQMVLIQHKNGDFSLLAGFAKINVREGDKVNKDSAIGTLSSSTNPLPRLYYELRRNGEKPVDPTALF